MQAFVFDPLDVIIKTKLGTLFEFEVYLHTRAYRPLDESTVHRSARTALTSFFPLRSGSLTN